MTTNENTLKIGTRGSTLALWQAHHVQSLLEDVHPETAIEIVPIKTTGDIIQDVALAQLEGKAFFTKEIEDALLSGQVDLAVHSGKDVPTAQPEGLTIAGFLKRHSPLDAWISRSGESFDRIPLGAKVGTSSLRRRALIAASRSDLTIDDLRGNVDTRLRKLKEGEYDAIILAAAGLERLGMLDRATELLSPGMFPPAVAQGAIAIETRTADTNTNEIVKAIIDRKTTVAATAERALLQYLEGGCQVPLGALATIHDETLTIRASLLSLDGTVRIDDIVTGTSTEAALLGRTLAKMLIDRGGDALLKNIRAQHPV